MGKPGSGYWCAPIGLQRAGPREGARYGHRGVIVGETSHPGHAPTPADLSGAASPGKVLRYMRPTAGGGIGPSRGGGHRQGKGGRASGSGRRGKSSVGARADPSTPTTPPGGDIDGAGESSTRPEGATPRGLGTGPPLVYAPLGGVGPPAVDMADDRADDRTSQAAGDGAGDEEVARAQDEPLLAARPRDSPCPAGPVAGAGDPQRRGGSDDESMPPADPRAFSPIRSGDIPMAGCDGDGATPAPARGETPPDASMPDGSGGGDGSATVPPPADGAPPVGGGGPKEEGAVPSWA